jgi:hypothetical protein
VSTTPDTIAANRVKRTDWPVAPANSPDGTAIGTPRQRNWTSIDPTFAGNDVIYPEQPFRISGQIRFRF